MSKQKIPQIISHVPLRRTLARRRVVQWVHAGVRGTLAKSCLAVWIASLAACRHVPESSSSYRVIDPTGSGSPAAVDARELKLTAPTKFRVEAKLTSGTPAPKYPAAALDAKAGTVSIAVTLVIDAEGRVTSVTKNQNYPAVPSPFEDQFIDAIRVAVLQWTFDAAQVADLEPGPDGRPVVIRSSTAESTLDLVFTFEAGKVTTAR